MLSWTTGEWIVKGKPSMLGAGSGAVEEEREGLDITSHGERAYDLFSACDLQMAPRAPAPATLWHAGGACGYSAIRGPARPAPV